MIFAIDGGGTTFKTCLVDEQGKLSGFEDFPLEVDAGIPGLREPLNRIFQERRVECEKAKRPIRAIGLGCRGIIEPSTKKLLDDSGVMNFFSGHAFTELIDSSLPFGVANDAVAAAMGENKFGAGRRYRNFVLLTLGTGIGGGIILDGKVLQRSTEMGHYPVNPNGDICGCGNIGCIEREFSASAFQSRWEAINPTRAIDNRIQNVKHLFELAEKGDREALTIMRRGVHFLARGLSGYSNALDPERIILSGGLSKAGPYLMNMIVEELRPILWRKDPETFVEFSALGAQMGLYGAGAVGAAQVE